MPGTIPTRHQFWRVFSVGRTSSSLGELAAVAGLEASVATEMSLDGEAWLESATEMQGMQSFFEKRGWRVMDDVRAELIAAPVAGTASDPATHRLYLRYAAEAASLAELDRWYAEEHEQMLLRSTAWCRIRRFRTGDPSQPGRLVVHEVSDPRVLDSVELRAAMSTPWRDSLASKSWFHLSPRQAWRVLAAQPAAKPTQFTSQNPRSEQM